MQEVGDQNSIQKILFEVIPPVYENPFYEYNLVNKDNLMYERYLPLFMNLYENKIIYRETSTIIGTLEDIQLTPEKFKATIKQHLVIIEENLLRRPKKIRDKWDFSFTWAYLSNAENRISPYSGIFTIWTNPNLVKEVEELVLRGEKKKAYALLRC